MTAQLRINDRGELEPVTWDGQPLYSRETVREGLSEAEMLFDPRAFDQLPGQMPMEDESNGSDET